MSDSNPIKPKRKPEFRESLAPSMPIALAGNPVTVRSRSLGVGLWILTVVLVGAALGAALRARPADVASLVAVGPVAKVSDAPFAKVLASKALAASVAVTPNLGTIETSASTTGPKLIVLPVAITGTSLQTTLANDTLFVARDINALQSDFASYGMQGAVGVSAIR